MFALACSPVHHPKKKKKNYSLSEIAKYFALQPYIQLLAPCCLSGNTALSLVIVVDLCFMNGCHHFQNFLLIVYDPNKAWEVPPDFSMSMSLGAAEAMY